MMKRNNYIDCIYLGDFRKYREKYKFRYVKSDNIMRNYWCSFKIKKGINVRVFNGMRFSYPYTKCNKYYIGSPLLIFKYLMVVGFSSWVK